MANRAYWPNRKGLRKQIGRNHVYLGLACDLIHGHGWFCQVHERELFGQFAGFSTGRYGFGFHKTNKFTAFRMALEQMKKSHAIQT